MMMHIEFNEKIDRKKLVEALKEITGFESEYFGPPTFAYGVGDNYRVDRDGSLRSVDEISEDDIDKLLKKLTWRGFEGHQVELKELPDGPFCCDDSVSELKEGDRGENIIPEQESDTTQDNSGQELALEEEQISGIGDDERIVISIPKNSVTEDELERVRAIIASKAPVLKNAFETEDLSIQLTEDEIKFPWFKREDMEGEAQAYADFITAVVARAKKLSRVTAKECSSDNDKFTMRLFLVALELKGEKYKTTRKILMRNLKGDGAWHTPDGKAKSLAKKERLAHSVKDEVSAGENEAIVNNMLTEPEGDIGELAVEVDGGNNDGAEEE